MEYTVVYSTHCRNEAERNTALALNDANEKATLEEVVANCKELSIGAKLYDAAGFTKGTVDADGNYRLS